jgi:hypothetical protein
LRVLGELPGESDCQYGSSVFLNLRLGHMSFAILTCRAGRGGIGPYRDSH